MSVRIGKLAIVAVEKPQQCDFCGEVKELRPYGPNGECICFDCGMKDKATTEKRMGIVLFGDPEEPTDA